MTGLRIESGIYWISVPANPALDEVIDDRGEVDSEHPLRSHLSGLPEDYFPVIQFWMKFSTTGVILRPTIHCGPNTSDCST